MIAFDPAEPFPLLDLESYTHVEAQTHAARVDSWLGLRTQEVEESLLKHGCRDKCPGAHGEKQNLWIGLATQNLLSPYTEIRRVLTFLEPKPGSTMIDLGAAYGRIGFVLSRHFPTVNFIGYEYVGERVKESNRCATRLALRRFKLEQADLTASDFMPPAAEYYFIYDYGTMKAIEKTLYDLRRIATGNPLTLIVGGRLCHEAIEWRHSWLEPQIFHGARSRYSIFVSKI